MLQARFADVSASVRVQAIHTACQIAEQDDERVVKGLVELMADADRSQIR